MTEGSFSAKKKERVAIQRRYQIDQQRAVQQFRQMAREENPNIQMIVPMAEVVGLLQEGVGHLLREAGLALMNLVMEEEVRHLAGERYQQHPERRAHRWGKEDGYCVVDGQKVPIRRTRLRSRKIASNGWAVMNCSSAVRRRGACRPRHPRHEPGVKQVSSCSPV